METSGAAAQLHGLRPAQTPRFAGTLSGSWERDGKSAELVLRRVGDQFEDDLNSRVLKGATTLDASAAWPLSRRLQLTARVENLSDAVVMAAFNGDGSIERATPRTLWLGLRLR
jgi:outer membrane receptor protein involved in Fe transport